MWKSETCTHTLSFKHEHNVSYFLSQRSGGFLDPKLPGHYIMSGVTGHCEEEPIYAWPLPFSVLDIKARNALCSNNIIIQKNSPSKQQKTHFQNLQKTHWVYDITKCKRKLNIKFSAYCTYPISIRSISKMYGTRTIRVYI